MTPIPVRVVETIDPVVLERVTATFSQCRTLGALMAWCSAQSPRANIDEIITQDEYTHDVLLAFGHSTYLSFDTT